MGANRVEAVALAGPSLWGADLPPVDASAPSLEQPRPVRATRQTTNPLRRIYGPGPDGATCGQCRYCITSRPGQNSYNKCMLRGMTRGTGTDQRTRWQACGQFAPSGLPVEGHLLPPRWETRLPEPPKGLAKVTRCPHCQEALAVHIGAVYYGHPGPGSAQEDADRCPGKPPPLPGELFTILTTQGD